MNSFITESKKTADDETEKLEKWLPLVRSRAYAFRQSGAETEDLIQEGLIGLLYAVRAFREGYAASFETFAYICITNRLRFAAARLGRQLSVNGDEEDIAQSSLSVGCEEDPQELFIIGEQVQGWFDAADKLLSPMENRVLRLYLSGYSYREMASALKISQKSVDNALSRARKKLREKNEPALSSAGGK